ncbi:MAG: PsbP-related protein [Patescibacteria group bacterium]
MKKILLFTTVLALMLTGCATNQNQAVQNQPTNVVAEQSNDTATVNTNTDVQVKVVASASETDATSDWQTHSNDNYGFSFKAPSEFIIDEEKKGDGYYYNLEANDEDIKITAPIFIILKKDSEGLNLSDWAKKNVDVNNKLSFPEYKTKSGVNGISMSGATDLADYGNYAYYSYFFKKGNYIYAVAAGSQDHSFIESYNYNNDEIISAILNSFDFVDGL